MRLTTSNTVTIGAATNTSRDPNTDEMTPRISTMASVKMFSWTSCKPNVALAGPSCFPRVLNDRAVFEERQGWASNQRRTAASVESSPKRNGQMR